MHHKGYKSRTLMGLKGPVTVRRARFRCAKTQAFEYPLDVALDLPSHEVTVSVARRALRLSTPMSFETVQEELVYQHEVRLSDAVLDRVMQTAGQVAEQDRRQGLFSRCDAPPRWGSSRRGGACVRIPKGSRDRP